MTYIKNWTDFETAATDLYARSPSKVRYCVKFQPKTGHLVLKITDDVKCLKYKTFSSIILNRFDSLNLRLLSAMTNTRARPRPAALTAVAADTPERGGTPAPPATGAEDTAAGAGPGAGAGAGGSGGTGQVPSKTNTGGKKKKKGKR